MVLDDIGVAEPQPEPPAEEPWEDFVARQRAREAVQAAREARAVDRGIIRGNQWPDRVAVGVGPNGVRRVGVYDPITGRYNTRDEE